ncbi:MAG: Do family serine endopeptidase, partial [Alphaproteobacteria bacterium]|nr:Do family serine endopeptidase [Alphaproteobacteria bacterium]
MDAQQPAGGNAKLGPARPARTTVNAIAALALISGGLAVTSGSFSKMANAQRAAPGQEVVTPFGRAPLSFADIVEQVKPAVVSVSVVNDGSKDEKKKKDGGGVIPGIPEDSPLHDFFKNLPKEFRGRPGPSQPRRGQGSGFVVSTDGYVVTNNHVIDGATKIQVSFDDLEKIDAELVGTDARTDLALLKMKSTKVFPAVKFAKGKPRVGDWALAIGNPFGLGGTVTAGIVSALARDINEGPYDFMQIDAAVNKGNSGGPTFNLKGEVIGVNTAIFSPSGGNVGIAFAVPAARVEKVIEQLKKTGTVARGWLGVKIQNIDEDTAASLGLPAAKGALVSDVTPDGPAKKAGFKVQDAILEVNGDTIADSRDLARKIAEITPGTNVAVKVWRGNAYQTINLTLGTFPTTRAEIAKLREGKAPTKEASKKMALDQLGLTLMPAKSGDASDGVAIAEVDPKSDAAQKGLRSGDVILQVDRRLVSSPEEVVTNVKRVKDQGRAAVL